MRADYRGIREIPLIVADSAPPPPETDLDTPLKVGRAANQSQIAIVAHAVVHYRTAPTNQVGGVGFGGPLGVTLILVTRRTSVHWPPQD